MITVNNNQNLQYSTFVLGKMRETRVRKRLQDQKILLMLAAEAGRWEIQWTQKAQVTKFTIDSCKQCMISKTPLEMCLTHVRKWGEEKPHIRWIFLCHALFSTKAARSVGSELWNSPSYQKNIQQNNVSSPLAEKKLQTRVPPQGFLAGQWELLFSRSV